MNWHDTRKILRKDSRYELADLLDKKAKEKLYDDHIMVLDRKRRDHFYEVFFDF